jgi:hypothetical protein
MRVWAEDTRLCGEALTHAGDWTGARRELDEAMRCAEVVGERLYLSQLLLLGSRIADALGETDHASESVRQALAEARTQEAPWLELLALSELCRHDDATASDRRSLAAIVNQLPEASDTNAVKNAQALIQKRKSPRQ